jgi:hypothetical protein
MPSIVHSHPSVPADGSKPEGAGRGLPAARPCEGSCAVLGCILAAYGGALVAGYSTPLAGVAFTVAGAAVAVFGDRVSLWLSARLMNASIAATPRRPIGRRGRRLLGSAAVSAALMLATPAAGLASPQVDLTYGGLAPGHQPVYLELAPGGRSIREVVGALDVKCESGMSMGVTEGYERLPVSATGKFGTSYADPPEREGSTEVSWSGAIRGRFDRRRSTAKGTWTVKFTATDTSTGQTDTCSATTPFTVYR